MTAASAAVPAYRRMNEVFETTCDTTPEVIAVVCDGAEFTYADLDAYANRIARHLMDLGIGVDDRVGILLHRSVDTYATLLGIQKAGAAFVPIDPGAPADRVEYILTDSGAGLVVTSSHFAPVLTGTTIPRVLVDDDADAIAAQPDTRPALPDYTHDPTAYIIYTSGSTGRPKGVEIAQSSICNFLTVIPTVYDVRPGDRVYQGMTISFDFSIEEIWPTFAHGATLIVAPAHEANLGDDLAQFLDDQRVTMMYCVPTLLATIGRDLPRLRSILVGGEACPRELVERWAAPHRRILNTYGPTEATVTATWCELLPGRPVTIGVPVPTYSIVILDEQRNEVPHGQVGEISIGGIGVARGYVGRPDLTADRFLDHPAAPHSKLYRTGDLGRWTDDGEVEYLGRADAEVKVRGHRVDLGEIESVLMADPDVASAVVAMMPAPTGSDELTAYLVRRNDAATVEEADLLARLHMELHARLPEYMVPQYVDLADELPMMPSGKVYRKRLPNPTGRRFTTLVTGPIVAPSTPTERDLVRIFSAVLGLPADEISTEADLFADLGGHSLLVARLVSALREESDSASLSVRDVYENPTIARLATVVDDGLRGAEPAARIPAVTPSPRSLVAAAGTAQAVFLFVVMLVVTAPVSVVYHLNDGQATLSTLWGLLIATVPMYLGIRWLLPVLLVRPLSAGIEPGEYPLWGRTYVRLWITDRLLSWSPLPVLAGSSLAGGFLRLLGAGVGRHARIGTGTIGLPRLVSIGHRAAIGNNVTLRPWTVRGTTVHVDRIVIGDDAVIGANSLIEPGTTVGSGAVVGEQSLVGADLDVTPGSRWAGAPARAVDRVSPNLEALVALPAAPAGSRSVAAASVLGLLFLEGLAIATIVPSLVVVWTVLLNFGMIAALAVTLSTGPVYVATVCAIVLTGKQLVLRRMPEGVHHEDSILGVRKWIVDKLLEMSLEYTNTLYATLYTTPWLRALGARIGDGAEVSTVAHIDPDLLTIAAESFVADMAGVGGSAHANGYFSTARTTVGRRSFIGNAALLPAGTTTGNDSLIGVLTVPADKEVPAGSSWLGSPAIYLPARQNSGDFDLAETYRPDRKTVWHRWWIEFHRITLPATILGVSLYFYLQGVSWLARTQDLLAVLLLAPFLAFAAGVGVVLFCAATKNNLIGRYRPRVAPLWDRFARRTEFVTGLYESAAVPVLIDQLRGTPFFAGAMRTFGVRIGRRSYIDTTYLTEFDLVTIGDDAAVGHDVSLQTHLFEDRVMKMSDVVIGDRATLGDRAIALYDSRVDTGAELAPLSVLMKGEELPESTSWSGIPAQATRTAVTESAR